MNVDHVPEKLHLCLLVSCSYRHQVACSLLCLFHNQRTLVFLLYRPVSVSFQSELRHTLLNQILLHSLSQVFFYSILRMELSLFYRLLCQTCMHSALYFTLCPSVIFSNFCETFSSNSPLCSVASAIYRFSVL